MSGPADFSWDFREAGPVADLDAAWPHLRRPFAPAAVRWKVQTAGSGYGIVVAYIDVRLVTERLNLVVGAEWTDAPPKGGYRALGQGVEECTLSVFDVARADVGQAQGLQAAKAARSDALKRTAVKFGIGVSIYALKSVLLDATPAKQPEGSKLLVKNAERGSQGKKHWTAQMSLAAERWLAEKYEAWLDARGIELFGPPLDHGDEQGAAGLEAEEGGGAPAASSEGEESEPAGGAQIEGEEADRLRAGALEHYQAIRKMNAAAIPPAQHRTRLAKAGSESIEALHEYVAELAGIRVNMEEERAK